MTQRARFFSDNECIETREGKVGQRFGDLVKITCDNGDAYWVPHWDLEIIRRKR